MSDHSISLVPIISEYPDAKQKAANIIHWLISTDVIKSELSTCIGSAGFGYAPANRASSITDSTDSSFFDFIPNGLEVITERHIFDAGGNGLDKLICPICRNNIVTADWDLNPWYTQKNNYLQCPMCERESEIHSYTFEPI